MQKFLIALILFLNITLIAHPTGNLIINNNKVYWSYVYPVGDPDHHACIMVWDEKDGARPWIISEYSGSDWMMSPSSEGGFYFVERYYDAQIQNHRSRIFYYESDTDIKEIMSWFVDEYHFGEGGFIPTENGNFIFAKYPYILYMNSDGTVNNWIDWHKPVSRIRYINDESFLIKGDSSIWIVDYNGKNLNEWSNLIEPLDSDPPFLGNRIFDADFNDGDLWIAYWGKRRLDLINGNAREVIKTFNEPFLPHAVGAKGDKVFILTSTISPYVNQQILPNLWKYENNNSELIWGEPTGINDVESENKMIPNRLRIYQNFPNPFNPSTTIKYFLPESSVVNITVFNSAGEKVASLVNSFQSKGLNLVEWNGIDEHGNTVSSGIYFYRIESGGKALIKKMLLIK